MSKPYPPVEYQNYLQLDQLVNSQKLKSAEYGKPAHDEMLFIIVHQVYELWFKQILTELNSVLELFKNSAVDDSHMGTIVARLERITEIQNILIQQIRVLETMTPLDFLDFRDFLYPASGFQSIQNRMIENKMGLKSEARIRFNQAGYESYIAEPYRSELKKSQEEPSLFEVVEKWLERTPFLSVAGFDFWQEYRKAADGLLQNDLAAIESNTLLTEADRAKGRKELQTTRETFEALFNESNYQELQTQGQWRLSFKALHAALFITIYRDQPVLQQPHRLITALLNIDENFTTWRYRHALMAHRMLGKKMGTGGSSGHDYLRQATDRHKVFTDFFNLTTFFIPRSQRPELPAELKKHLGFSYAQ